MNVLIACECSGRVRDEFTRLGHHAASCDLRPSETPGKHYREDVRGVLWYGPRWDLLIAFPPCTHLCVSGALHFRAKRKDGRQQAAIDFFMMLANANVPRICIENPVGIMSTLWRKPDQIINPFEFGDDASKKTCLWLKGLPALVLDPADYVKPRMVCQCGAVLTYEQNFKYGCPKCGPGFAKPRWANQCDSGQNKLGPSPTRPQDRARTYPGIARAMASQWGRLEQAAVATAARSGRIHRQKTKG